MKASIKEDSLRSRYSKSVKASHKFVAILAIVSIIGFLGIISKTLFDYSADLFVESFLMIVIGIGLIMEGKIRNLKKIKAEGLTPYNFTNLVTLIIGFLALMTGVFSLPSIRIETQGFLAIKGIIAIIAIIIIIVQTWVVD